MKDILYLIFFVPLFTSAQYGIGVLKKDVSPKNILIIMFGESNSTGQALNSDATTLELSSRPKVQFWNNSNDTGFYALEPGVNSLVGDSGVSGLGTMHGMDLELANKVYANSFSNTDTIYLVKAGRGGSTAGNWGSSSSLWTTWKRRVNDAINTIKAKSNKPLYIYNMVSIGINDAALGTNGALWYSQMTDLISRVVSEIGSTSFYLTYIPSTSFAAIDINNQITSMQSNYSYIKAIPISDCKLRSDNMHWSYSGLKKICDRMLDYITYDYNRR